MAFKSKTSVAKINNKRFIRLGSVLYGVEIRIACIVTRKILITTIQTPKTLGRFSGQHMVLRLRQNLGKPNADLSFKKKFIPYT